MHILQMETIRRTGLSAALILGLAACAGGVTPTPPSTIGNAPQSIMDSQPAAVDYTDSGQQNASLGDTEGLPPASSLSNSAATQAPSAGYQVPASNAFLTFEPMVGAPKHVARELSKSLGLRIAQQSLPVVARTDKKVTHRVKGYFSASKSGSDCVVSYVWDIFDANGKRINRVTGSQKTTMVSTDPWDSVKGPVLDKVSVDTAAKLKSWHASI